MGWSKSDPPRLSAPEMAKKKGSGPTHLPPIFYYFLEKIWHSRSHCRRLRRRPQALPGATAVTSLAEVDVAADDDAEDEDEAAGGDDLPHEGGGGHHRLRRRRRQGRGRW
mgnify:CR=1 FL=1